MSSINVSKCFLYIFEFFNFSANFGEDFVKQYKVKIIKGVVGITGKNIPMIPKMRDKIPNVKNKNFIA